MYANYDKLWLLLKERHLKKTTLRETTGLSSRTIAKLSANGIVTTDTLARICDVLQCDVGDIMSFTNEEPIVSLYEAFKKKSILINSTKYFNVYEFDFEGISYQVAITANKADKNTIIKCESNSVQWIQTNDNKEIISKHTIAKIEPPEDESISLIVIDGLPSRFIGLNEGFYKSFNREIDCNHIYVMSISEFKCLTNNKED